MYFRHVHTSCLSEIYRSILIFIHWFCNRHLLYWIKQDDSSKELRFGGNPFDRTGKIYERSYPAAKKARVLEEVPIGCVIVSDGKIIARGYNRRNTDKNTLSHAELNAIRKASKKLGDWRLEGCTMYGDTWAVSDVRRVHWCSQELMKLWSAVWIRRRDVQWIGVEPSGGGRL